MSTTASAVRLALTARIVALTPASSYRQAAADAWTESKAPLIPELTPETQANLAFFVDDRELRLISTRQAGADFRVDAPVTVRFLYRMRSTDAVNDWDRAGKAGEALLSWLASYQDADFDLHFNEATLTRQVLGTDKLALSLRFNVIYYL
jgi:hypothetical protein